MKQWRYVYYRQREAYHKFHLQILQDYVQWQRQLSAEEYQGKINIYKIDTEAEQELAAAFGIRSIPSMLFLLLSNASDFQTANEYHGNAQQLRNLDWEASGKMHDSRHYPICSHGWNL